jgi:maleylacetate reductase
VTVRFAHETLPQRVVFASFEAAEHVAGEVARLGACRAMVMHVPGDVAERARKAADKHNVDVLVSIGGGSATGLAKAVALTSGLPIVAVPTTYAGSEATNVWGLTEGSRKTTGVDSRVLPRAIVYDASLMLSLPVPLSVASGLNALAHCVDSMWAPRTDPVDQALALEGIRALREGLPEVMRDPHGIEGREQTLCGAWMATVAFGVASALDGLQRLRERVAAPRALRDYGLRENDIPAAVDAILAAVPPGNPVPVTAANLEELLHRAREGREPR